MSIKFAQKKYNISAVPADILEFPVFIIGISPGKQRKGNKNYIVWEGNRSGDFLFNSLKDINNLYFTNMSNYINPTAEELYSGIRELRLDIAFYKPRLVILLGNKTLALCCTHIVPFHSINMCYFQHPSYILRFNKDKVKYINSIREAITR